MLNKTYKLVALFALCVVSSQQAGGGKKGRKGTTMSLAEFGAKFDGRGGKYRTEEGGSSVDARFEGSPVTVVGGRDSASPTSPSAVLSDERAQELAAAFYAGQTRKGDRSPEWGDEEDSDRRGARGRKGQTTKHRDDVVRRGKE